VDWSRLRDKEGWEGVGVWQGGAEKERMFGGVGRGGVVWRCHHVFTGSVSMFCFVLCCGADCRSRQRARASENFRPFFPCLFLNAASFAPSHLRLGFNLHSATLWGDIERTALSSVRIGNL